MIERLVFIQTKLGIKLTAKSSKLTHTLYYHYWIQISLFRCCVHEMEQAETAALVAADGTPPPPTRDLDQLLRWWEYLWG